MVFYPKWHHLPAANPPVSDPAWVGDFEVWLQERRDAEPRIKHERNREWLHEQWQQDIARLHWLRDEKRMLAERKARGHG